MFSYDTNLEDVFSKIKKTSEKDKFVVGYLGPLTGDSSSLGFSAKKAIELAKKDLAADDYRLIHVDTKCRADETEKGIQKLLNEGAQAIIGEVWVARLRCLGYRTDTGTPS